MNEQLYALLNELELVESVPGNGGHHKLNYRPQGKTLADVSAELNRITSSVKEIDGYREYRVDGCRILVKKVEDYDAPITVYPENRHHPCPDAIYANGEYVYTLNKFIGNGKFHRILTEDE